MLSWNSISKLLIAASLGSIAVTAVIAPMGLNWLSNPANDQLVSEMSLPSPRVIQKDPKKRVTVTEDQLESAALINLQRMNPPKPLPPPPQPTKEPEPPPPPPRTILYQGTLLGTIQESDPKYSFALLRGSDNRTRLVPTGGPIEETSDPITVSKVGYKEVTLVKGELSQVLTVAEPQ
jgi:hypothetical protein